MQFTEMLIIVSGLIVFEILISVDNAIINAHVLKTMQMKWRKRFLFIGILTSVLFVRLVLPLAIIWIVIPGISLAEMAELFTTTNSVAAQAFEKQEPLILIFGGMFLLLVYLHWLFMEKKRPLFMHERLINESYDVWFFAAAGVLMVILLYFARSSPNMMLFAAIGSATFFILYGFKETAEKTEEKLLKRGASDMSKFMYLEVLDATFSFDSIVGAFAFTTNLSLIFIGLGAGALILRELTIMGIDRVSKYVWLKNGAMNSIAFLSVFMILESFKVEMPHYLPTAITLLLVGYSFLRSKEELKRLQLV